MTRLSALPCACLLLLPLAPGCDGGQVGEEAATCAPVETTALGADEPSPLGVSAAELVAAVGGQFSGPVTWADAAPPSAAELEVALGDGAIEYQRRDWVGDGPVPEIGGCDDALVVPVTVMLSSADGRLAESWTAQLTSSAADSGWVSPKLDGFSGTLAVDAFAPRGDWDQLRPLVDIALAPDQATVTISGQASRSEGETASAQNFEIGAIAAERP